MSVPPTPFGVVTEMIDEWINVHPQNCNTWNEDWNISTERDDRFIPPDFSFKFYFDAEWDKDNYTDLPITHCPFCGADLIHWIEKQQRAKVKKI